MVAKERHIHLLNRKTYGTDFEQREGRCKLSKINNKKADHVCSIDYGWEVIGFC
jgi:hypothetical protein